VTPEQFWRLHPQEFWWWLDAQRAQRVYQGKRHSITGADVDGILDDLRAKGITPRWRSKRK
jgi:hypothetical protein